MTSNYPPDYNPDIDSGEDPIEEVPEFDDSDDFRENLPIDVKDISEVIASTGKDEFGIDLGLPDGDTSVELDEDPLGLGL